MTSTRTTTTATGGVSKSDARPASDKYTDQQLTNNITTATLQGSPEPKAPGVLIPQPVLQKSVFSRTSVLLVDVDANHSERLARRLESAGFITDKVGQLSSAERALRNGRHYEIVIVDISNPTKDWSSVLHNLQEAAYQSDRHLGPFFLCMSRVKHPPELRLALERKGARLAFER